MAFAGDIVSQTKFIDRIVRPSQIPVPWVTVITAGGLDTAAVANPLINVTDDIQNGANAAFLKVLKIGKKGTTLRLRMKYDDAEDESTNTDPIIKVFGRYDSTQQWEILPNKAGALFCTMTLDISHNVTDGTDFWTSPDANEHSFDLNGVDEVVFGVEVEYTAGAGGNEALATLEAKVI